MTDRASPEPGAAPPAEPGADRRALGLRIRRGLSDLFSLATLRVLVAAYRRFERHEGFVLSGYIAYATLLAVFPFLIFLTSLAAATIGPQEFEALKELIFDVAPAEVARQVQPVLEEALGRERPGLLTFSGLAAIWFSSNGVEAFRTAFERAYQPRRTRHYVLARAIGVLFVVLGGGVALLLGLLVVLAPALIALLEQLFAVSVPWGLGLLRYLLALGAFAVFLWLMHRILPSRRPGGRLWPGILATIAAWTVAASAFSVYLANFGRFSVTYGSLAGVIVTLLFFYISGLIIIYGAEVNAALGRRGSVDTGPKRGDEPWR